MARRHKFSKDELSRYFDRICIPEARRAYNVAELDEDVKFKFLSLILKHHLCKAPWENLVQHYSWHRTVHLRPQHLFKKIVDQPGRGGYCMENNFFFHLVLYSLGFQAYMAGSRIYSDVTRMYGGWSHVVNLVTIAGKRYLIDSGFGGQGPPRPVPLDHGVESPHLGPGQLRVMYEPIPDNLDQSHKLWTYQYRRDEASDWAIMYCFTDFEFTPADVNSMNFAPWLSRNTFFTHKVVCVRYTTDRETDSNGGPGSPDEEALDGEIDGYLTLNQDTLKWRRKGEKTLDITFKKDADRVEALEKYFGIYLAEEDREAIVNSAAMVAGRAMATEG